MLVHTAADYAAERAGGALRPELCAALVPNATCVAPPAACAEYPGCIPAAAGWGATPASCATAAAVTVTCSATVTFSNGSVTVETAADPSEAWLAARCAAGAAGACTRTLTARFEQHTTTYTDLPVFAEDVCARYHKECTSCFCVDTIGDFWLVWVFSLSEGYAGVCSAQFGQLVQEVLLFAASVASVVLVNMALKLLLRMSPPPSY